MGYTNDWVVQAVEKLDREKSQVSGQKEKIMAEPVLEALKNFCRQDEEFAQAVAQGKPFKNCMEAVAKGVGQHISDIDAYKRAVQFYFPGAKIAVTMSIDLIGDAAAPVASTESKQATKAKILSLEDLLDL